jgi:hypothetical protein
MQRPMCLVRGKRIICSSLYKYVLLCETAIYVVIDLGDFVGRMYSD